MYVYFIRCRGDKSRLKIGKAADPNRRLAELQTGCPYPMTLESKIKCRSEKHAFYVEKLAHVYFKDYRTQGEWFKCTDAVLSKVWEFEQFAEATSHA
jgi:hypothetical protein